MKSNDRRATAELGRALSTAEQLQERVTELEEKLAAARARIAELEVEPRQGPQRCETEDRFEQSVTQHRDAAREGALPWYRCV